MAKQKSIATESVAELEEANAVAMEASAEQVPNEESSVQSPKQESKEAPKAASKAEKCFVYIGPSLPGGVLKKNASFIGTESEVRKYLANVIAEYPSVSRLLVPSSALAESKARMNAGGNVLRKAYDNAAKKQKEVTGNG